MKFASILGLASVATATLPAINITGNAFWDSSTGDRFYVRGVAYQPGGSSNLTDPLGDADTCKRDIAYFKDLGLNTIRVYSVDNTLDHTECMEALDAAGIYLLLDVNTPKASLSGWDTECSYNIDYLNEVMSIVDEFATYSNVLGFFAANELVNSEDTLETAPYIKAVVRDLHQYIAAQNYRDIPIGYAAADISEVRKELAHYLNCGNDTDARIDMLGVNDYSWCGKSSFTTSGYSQKVDLYSDYSAPIFLSEYGCNTISPRAFTEVKAIYSTEMSSVFSGGVVYEYSEETDKFGLVDISSDGTVTELTDYDNLKSELNETTDPTGDAGYSLDYDASDCPTDWNFSTTVPDSPSGFASLCKDGASGGNGFEYDTQESCPDDEKSSSVASSTTTSKSSTSTSKTASATSTSSSSSAMAQELQAHGYAAVLAAMAGFFFF